MSSKTKAIATDEKARPAVVPKLRFPEFRSAEVRSLRLGDVTEEGRGRNGTKHSVASVMGVTKADGIVPMEARLISAEIARYKLVENDWFAYNPMRLNIGSIARWEGEHEILVSPDYVVFKCITDNEPGLAPGYFDQFRQTKAWEEFVTEGGDGSVRVRIYYKDIARVGLALPSFTEQQKIAECLSSVDELMAAQARKVAALKNHKKGLMQQLFPREGETQPRVRFPEFQNAGEWNEERLDHLAHFQDGFAFKSTDFVKEQDDATQVIRITDINNKNTNEDKVCIPTAFLESNKLGKYQVDDGDLLLSLTGAAGFNFFFWNGGPAAINQRTAKVTSKKKSGDALLRLLEPLIHEKINERGEGQNNNLSKEFLSTIVLRVPEPEEQQRIADCLTNIDNLIAAQTQKLEALKTHKKGLMQQLFPSPEEATP
jgi:type I restriction enzyme S subunit